MAAADAANDTWPPQPLLPPLPPPPPPPPTTGPCYSCRGDDKCGSRCGAHPRMPSDVNALSSAGFYGCQRNTDFGFSDGGMATQLIVNSTVNMVMPKCCSFESIFYISFFPSPRPSLTLPIFLTVIDTSSCSPNMRN
jgi:hypothetical protein